MMVCMFEGFVDAWVSGRSVVLLFGEMIFIVAKYIIRLDDD